MAQIRIYGAGETLLQFVTAHKTAINHMQTLLKQAHAVNDVFVMDFEHEAYPQLVAVDGKGQKLAHIILSEEVVSGQSDALIFLDSCDFLNAGVATH